MEYNKEFFSKYIHNNKLYHAHIPKDGCCRQPELMSEHSSLVYEYAKNIVEKQNLYKIIDNLIKESILESFSHRKQMIELCSDLFWKAIAFHDLGKINKKFQKIKMRNHNSEILDVAHEFEANHSIISVYIFLADFFSNILKTELTEEEIVYICNVALYLSYPIYKHHSQSLEKAQDDEVWCNTQLYDLKPYLSSFNIDLNEEQIELYHESLLANANFDNLFKWFNFFENDNNSFPLFALVKLNYSLLTASDYLATAHYMNNWYEFYIDYSLIDNRLKDKIIYNAENYQYNKPVYESISNQLLYDQNILKECSNINLNILRMNIAIDVIKGINENRDKNLFYIEAPTGGGKTNVSMLALSELLKADLDNQINKVFYVFPFTTLITQTCKSLQSTLGLDDTELAEIHSKSSFLDSHHEDDYLNYLDNLFMNYPISVISHIHFFDILKTNQKEINYLLHRIANSIIIIDEIQSYSPSMWDIIVYFIVNYSRYFNIKFIVMSATLPKIGKLVEDEILSESFTYLIEDKNKYFKNPNFCNRVKFDYSLLEWIKPDKTEKSDYLKYLRDFVLEKSEEYSVNNKLNRNSVYTIVEFIFKSTASEFYSLIKENNDLFDEVYILSGTILEPQRKRIIEKLKSEELRSKNVLLITTQVVEAGVDIDMDLGFKDKSIFDSEEQLAGRINRNVRKSECTLYLFDCDSANIIYGKDMRYKEMVNYDADEYKKILNEKDFDIIYERIISDINKNNKRVTIENINDLKNEISTLDFRKVNERLKLIDNRNVSVFVPLDIEIKYFDKYIDVLDYFNIPYSNIISGYDIWQCYESIISDLDNDFISKKIELKKIYSLVSNFIFSIFPNGKDLKYLETYGYYKNGFLFLESYSEIYSLEDGIKTERFANSNFL